MVLCKFSFLQLRFFAVVDAIFKLKKILKTYSMIYYSEQVVLYSTAT
jgi:hypothetical protein